MSWRYLLGSLVLPPGGGLVLIFLGLLLFARRRRLGVSLAAAGLALLYAAAAPVTAYPLVDWLQYDQPLSSERLSESNAQAIVVLGAGIREYAPEYGGETVDEWSLERIRYAAHLQRLTGLPIVPSAGIAYTDGLPGAVLMRRALRQDFSAIVPWTEKHSKNTMENARLTANLLQQHGISRVLLVTHALHMRRALWAFHQTDLQVTPAPTGFYDTRPPRRFLLWVMPRASVMRESWFALHELLGGLWYRIWYGWLGTGP